MTLRDPKLLGDLLAAQILHESEIDDLTFALVQHLERAREHQPFLAVVEPVNGRFARLFASRPCAERLDDVVLSHLELARQLGRRRRSAQRGPELSLATPDPAP